MKLSIISFTRKGGKLAKSLEAKLSPFVTCNGYINEKYALESALKPLTQSISDWTKEQFVKADAILFIGACGIAVRSIAPYIKDKTTDPAVIVMDEQGNYCISLLSGHIGGANELTMLISSISNATPVITTATDINHQFSVDLFAVKNDLVIDNMELAKEVSSHILDGKTVGLSSDFCMDGKLPKGLEKESINTSLGIYLTLDKSNKPYKNTLYLSPKIISIGIGCKKGTSFHYIDEFVGSILKEQGFSMNCVRNVGSIDLKENEEGLLAFTKHYNLPFLTFSACELNTLSGDFSDSDFVKSITGVGNVCERAAILASNHGQLILKKHAKDGVTLALSYCDRRISF